MRRSAWLVAGMGLVALAALTSRSDAYLSDADLAVVSPLDVIEVVGYVALFVGIVLVPVMVLFGRRQRRTVPVATVPSRLSTIPRWASVLGLVVVVAIAVGQVAVLLAYLDDLRRARLPGAEQPGPPPIADPSEAAVGVARGLESLTIALVITAVLAAAAVALLIAWRRGSGPLDDADVARRTALTAEAIELGLDALRQEPDPRRAVIGAYAAMDRSMSRAGLAREVSEAPIEYLRRVFIGLRGVAEEVATITDLFHLAKFSRHEVDEGMRRVAIGALERLRAATEGHPG